MRLTDKIENKRLKSIAEKVSDGVPVGRDDAAHMLSTYDILDLGTIAHWLRTRLHGDATFYGVNMNLNHTNICELRCPLCAFSKDDGDDGAFLLSIDDIEARVRQAVSDGVDEVHIVGGLHPGLSLAYFETMLRRIKAVAPGMFIVAFSAVEMDYFSKINDIPLTEVFKRLMDAGLGAMPGGGAEIFATHVRDVIAPKKISGDKWLSVMRTAHALGLETNATLLYNHVETTPDIVDHLFRIRDLQDETGGFKTFVPLRFHEENTQISGGRNATGYDDIRLYATSRIVLSNIPHLKALWMYLGDKMAQVMQRFGADDIGATYNNEKVVHAAGAKTPDYGSEPFLRRLIKDAGMTPVKVTANYKTKPHNTETAE